MGANAALTRDQDPMIPKRPGKPVQQKRQRGAPKKMVGARLEGHLAKWVQKSEDAGMTATAVIIQAIEFSRDFSEILGDEWWEAERRAKVEGKSVGEVLARLALAALESERKKR